MYIWLVNKIEVYGLFSMNHTLQGDKYLSGLFTGWISSFLGSLVTPLSCVFKYVADLLLFFIVIDCQADVLMM